MTRDPRIDPRPGDIVATETGIRCVDEAFDVCCDPKIDRPASRIIRYRFQFATTACEPSPAICREVSLAHWRAHAIGCQIAHVME
jgi:hypothetical protein